MILLPCCKLRQYNATFIIYCYYLLRVSEEHHNIDDAREEFRIFFSPFFQEVQSTLTPDEARQRAHNIRIKYFITFFSTFPCRCYIVTTTYNL